MRSFAAIGLLITLTVALGVPPQAAKPEDGLVYFEKHIRPLFSQQCQGCHGSQKQKGGLRLDQAEFIRQGGDTGPIIKAGKPAESLLFQALSYQDENVKMPPRGKLAAEQIEHVKHWIDLGAPLPNAETAPKAAAPSNSFNLQERLQHWCYEPLRSVEAPLVKNRNWPLNSIDAFILAKLEGNGLRPSRDAEKAVWLRRVTFDLTGLPPAPSELAEFVQDTSPQSRERVVDRLLASPRYGERWARHWLDLVRYADTLGHEFDFDLPNAWRYRN